MKYEYKKESTYDDKVKCFRKDLIKMSPHLSLNYVWLIQL